MTRSARFAGLVVGRGDEQRLLRQALRGMAGGEPCALVVSGEAGVGKTWLIRQVVDEAVDNWGAEVLWGSCVQFGASSVPFAPMLGAMRALLPVADGSSDPVRLLSMIAARINDLASRIPTVLVVDDLQWADVSSLDLLAYLIAGFHSQNLAVVATCREENRPEGHPLHGWLADMRRMPFFGEIALSRLGLEDTAQLLAHVQQAAPDLELAALVQDRSDGNPYLTELLGAELDPKARDLPADAPQRLKDALTATWHRLDSDARAVTRILAVGGRPIDLGLLIEVAGRQGIEPAAVSAALRPAQDNGVVRVEEDGRLWFRHPLLADVLDETAPAYDRLRLHAVFADLLEARPERIAADLAVHHERAGHAVEAIDWSLRAADAAAAVHASAEEAQHLLRACALWPLVGEKGRDSIGRHVDLLQRAARVSQHIGRNGDAQRYLEEARALVDVRIDPLLSSRLLTAWCEVTWERAGPATAIVEERYEALRLTDGFPDSHERALALGGLAGAEHWDGHNESAAAHTQEALEVAKRTGSALALAQALNGWASLRPRLGVQGLPELGHALELARTCGDVDEIVDGTIWLMNALEAKLNLVEAAEAGQQAFGEALRLGEFNWSYFVAAKAAANLTALGRWDEARVLLREALAVRCVGIPGAAARLVAAELATREGQLDVADMHLARALEVVHPDFAGLRPALILTPAELRIAQGRPEEAITWIRERLDVSEALDDDAVDLDVLSYLIQAITEIVRKARAGRDGLTERRARAELTRWLDIFSAKFPTLAEPEGPSEDPHLLFARAELARCRGSADEVQRWERLVRQSTTLGWCWQEAYALLRLCEARVARGAPKTSLAPTLRRLHELAAGMGATPLVEQAEVLARVTRVNIDPVRLPDPADSSEAVNSLGVFAGLTAREAEILGYLVAGRTNAEIAKSLVISEKTVSVHVSNILRKTGTASRTEVAARALRLT